MSLSIDIACFQLALSLHFAHSELGNRDPMEVELQLLE